ncbi:hypothetical protein AAF712_009759 [Marasmius tenuissimus]|uniref:Glycosyltransferase family 2 protein n=1 Tax=Marasmius tenuissimus TaxID=585030 RepID=A0ABR2ZQB8_9AGAR
MANFVDRPSPIPAEKDVYLITGGCGFIVSDGNDSFYLWTQSNAEMFLKGSATAKSLHTKGHRVRIADIRALPANDICTEYVQGTLSDPTFCDAIMKDVHTVLHFAANMGGMGTIHEANDFTLYNENHTMTTNLLETAIRAGVTRLLYASSACVYPAHLQSSSGDGDVQLRETDAWTGSCPSPQGLYGLEKLHGEILVRQYTNKLSVRIARLHNVFGPGGSWRDGREKAPAALARKAVVLKRMGRAGPTFEIWGDGSQRRSFLYIDDCVEGLLRLLNSNHSEPINIGSDHSIDIKSLAVMALRSAGVDPSAVTFTYDTDKPVGVRSRNSHNELAQSVLGWTPQISLDEGMRRTVAWIDSELGQLLALEDDHPTLLHQLQHSTVVNLGDNTVTFAVLLPITSRGTGTPSTCLVHLQKFAASLSSTTWRDVRENNFRIKVYLAIDDDDEFLLMDAKAESVLQKECVWDVIRIVCKFPKGHVCSLWRKCATAAWEDGCDYFALFGDDVELLDEGWLRGIHKTFQELAGQNPNHIRGFGCVAFTDISFPGMPTFPVIHRTHMDIFNGEVIPSTFVNQDGDPFLYQLYRRFGCSIMAPFRLHNSIGGSNGARYEKQHLNGWTFDVLDNATSSVEKWLDPHQEHGIGRKLTLDVIIPSFRVQLGTLVPILELESSSTCSVMFIIIIDDPRSSGITDLQLKYGHRPDVRIRVNTSNLGASETRNRGMAESAAEWVFFLDDDVVPDSDILVEAEKVIRTNLNAAGFVGTTNFPPADTIFKTAVHLAGVTFFWDIATKLTEDIPWGVTANLVARRNNDGVQYDPIFPKTGGGEDIEFCVRKRDLFVADGKQGFLAAPEVVATHPWWHEGQRGYRRFFMWAKGDGALIALFPQHSYSEISPTSAHLFLYTSALTSLGVVTAQWSLAATGVVGFASTFIINVVHDLLRHLVREKTIDTRSTVTGIYWIVAVAESAVIRMVSEVGRVVGQVERGEWSMILRHRRFDWFVNRVGGEPIANERKNSRERFFLWLFVAVIILAIFPM